MPINGTKLVKDRTKQLFKTLDGINDAAYVGVPQDKNNRSEIGQSNATLAYIHDNGSPAANIPARPFMKPGIVSIKGEIKVALKEAYLSKDILRGLSRVGIIAMNSIRKTINNGIPPPLAESTLAARRRAGKTRTKPLVDTGQLRNSITYVIRRK